MTLLMRLPVPLSMPLAHEMRGVERGMPISASLRDVSLVADVGITKRMISAVFASVRSVLQRIFLGREILGR